MDIYEILHGFAAKTQSTDDVMRAIMRHGDWQAPVLYASEAFNTEMFDRIAIWGGNQGVTPPGELWFFTDDAAANRFVARGGQGGPYATGLFGCRLFRNIPDTLTCIRINPLSEPNESLTMGANGFHLLRMWAKSVQLEVLLAKMDQLGDEIAMPMLDFEGYAVIVLPSGGIATAVGAGGRQNPAMVFTSPDCAERVLREIGREAAAGMKLAYLSGRELFGQFEKLYELGIDGLVMNIRGPGVAQVLLPSKCSIISSYIEPAA